MRTHRLCQVTGLGALVLSAALLQGCGGSSSASATSNPITAATLSGTVTGFGSVVIDGVEVEDAYARVVHENADGSTSAALLQMGHRVRATHDGNGKASQVLIDAAVIGTVSAKGSNSLTVAGQAVTVNADSAAGPLTVYGGGYTDLSSVAVNALVQVHGTPVYDSVSKAYVVQATRIQKDTGTARVQVSGKVASYASTSTSTSFTLNGLNVTTSSATVLRPSGSTLANDVQVTAYGSAIQSGAQGGTLAATHVRVNRDQNSGSTTMQAQLSGVVSNYNATAGSFELQGSTVKVGTATITPAGASLKNSAYVLVRGSVASDGSITATEIRIRTQDTSTDLAKVLLIGPLSDYVNDSSFVVRGVPVDASSSTLVRASDCPATFSGYTGTVKVQATQQAATAVVLATRIDCPSSSNTRVIRPFEGTASSVDSTAKTFTLTRNNVSPASTLKVLWTDTTSFVGVSATTLEGKLLHVEGYTDSSNNFVARVVSLDDDSASAPARDDKKFRVRQGSADQSSSTASDSWTQYRSRKER